MPLNKGYISSNENVTTISLKNRSSESRDDEIVEQKEVRIAVTSDDEEVSFYSFKLFIFVVLFFFFLLSLGFSFYSLM